MDTPAVEKNIQYTSFRYWRIIVPIIILILIAEYVLLFFFYPASANTARVISNLNLTKSVSNALTKAANVTANAAKTAATATANAAKTAATATVKVATAAK
jgi:hypothetical protein